jgi:hypothetical protein
MTALELKTLLNEPEIGPARNSSIPEFCDSVRANYHTGLSRSHLYLLANEGKIKSVCIRRPGSTRGRRLWHLPSILGYLKTTMGEGGKLNHE